MDLKECEQKGFIKKTKEDKFLIRNLLEMSALKKETVSSIKPTNRNISILFSIAYDSLREILEAFCVSRGLKVLNHACIPYAMQKFKLDFDYDLFERLRWTRNSINYYGNKIDFAQGKILIKKTFVLREKFLKENF